MSTLSDVALSRSPVIGLWRGYPVTAIIPQSGRVQPQLAGSLLYIPSISVIRISDKCGLIIE